LLAYVENNPGKKTADIGKGINVSTRTAERYVKKLRDYGKIEFRGSKKTGGYYKK
jgi:predicted transcriptional regulator